MEKVLEGEDKKDLDSGQQRERGGREGENRQGSGWNEEAEKEKTKAGNGGFID